jgi:hypothetical protein
MSSIYLRSNRTPKYHYQSSSKSPGFWKDVNNQRSFFDHLAKVLKIQKKEDWYEVSVTTVIQMGGSFLSTYYNKSLIKGKAIR